MIARVFEARRDVLISASLGLYAGAMALAPSAAVLAVIAAPLLLVPLGWALLNSRTLWIGLFLGAVILLPPLPIALGDSGPHPSLLLAGAGLGLGLLRLDEWRLPAPGVGGPLPLSPQTVFSDGEYSCGA